MPQSSIPAGGTNKADLSITWHAMSAEDVVSQLGTQVQAGLTSEEAARRLAEYGPNQLAEKPRPTFLQLVLSPVEELRRHPADRGRGDLGRPGRMGRSGRHPGHRGAQRHPGCGAGKPGRGGPGGPEEAGRPRGADSARRAPGSGPGARSWCREISSSWKRATSSRPTCACWKRSTCASKKPP